MSIHTAVSYALTVGSVSVFTATGSLFTSPFVYAASSESATDLARVSAPEVELSECGVTDCLLCVVDELSPGIC